MKLHTAPAESAASGAAMDQPLPPRRGRMQRRLLAAAAMLAVCSLLWQLLPRGLQVDASSVRIGIVSAGLLRDDVALRATAVPLHSVMLDAVESGRVEEVQARDGSAVLQGEPLFRLSNPQRRLELLQRESEHAQQISNLNNLRVNVAAGRAVRQRRIADLEFALAQARKQHARTAALAGQGYISAAALEESADRLAQQSRLLADERAGDATESATQDAAVRQMEAAIARLDAGLKLVNAAIEALVVRAPVAGLLSDFRLQVGETITPGQHIGRIDEQERFKLAAQVDEFYLSRLTTGLSGSATLGGRTHAVTVSRIYPQIKDGRFALELSFSGDAPARLSPGQSLEATLTLGGTRSALLLPNGPFVNDSSGAVAYVLDRDGALATRRAVRLGRRNASQIEVQAGLAAGERVIISAYAGFGGAERLQLRGPIPLFTHDMTQ
jgi:HlyD family secretion protein